MRNERRKGNKGQEREGMNGWWKSEKENEGETEGGVER